MSAASVDPMAEWWAELDRTNAERDSLVAIANAGRHARLSILFARAVKARMDLSREIEEMEARLAAS